MWNNFAKNYDNWKILKTSIIYTLWALYMSQLSLLEMHSSGNDQRPLCHPTLLGILGARWPNTIYYWGRLRLAAPTGGGPWSINTPTLVGGQHTGVQITKLLGG